MKHQAYIATLLALVACSTDDVIDTSADNEITFDVVTDNVTRNISLHSNSSTPTKYSLWAGGVMSGSTTVTPYISNAIISYINGLVSFENGNKYYWPTNGKTLNFFALHGFSDAACSGTSNVQSGVNMVYHASAAGNTKLTISGVSIPENNTYQDDILYAVAPSQLKSTNNGRVTLNFRHALAQLKFQFKNTSKYLAVLVKKITVQNIYTGNGTDGAQSVDISGSSATQYTYSEDVPNDYAISQGGICTWSGIPVSTTNPYSNTSFTAGTGSEYINLSEGSNSFITIYPANSTPSAKPAKSPVSRNDGEDIAEEPEYPDDGNDGDNDDPVDGDEPTPLTPIVSTNEYSYVTDPILVIPQPFIGDGSYNLPVIETEYIGETPKSAPRRKLGASGAAGDGKAYIVLSCRIFSIININAYNTAKAAADFDLVTWLSDSSHADLLHGETGFEDFYIPIPEVIYTYKKSDDSTVDYYGWLAGNKYVYNINFGDNSDDFIGVSASTDAWAPGVTISIIP